MKIRQFWQFHGLNGWKYEKNLKKGPVCDEVPYKKLYRRGNVPDQNGDIFCHFAVCFASEENWAAKTFFEINGTISVSQNDKELANNEVAVSR